MLREREPGEHAREQPEAAGEPFGGPPGDLVLLGVGPAEPLEAGAPLRVEGVHGVTGPVAG